MKSISGGILADACGVMLSGGVGTMGQSTSSANVGLSIATGATSRRIGFACGGILMVLAFVPKLAVLFAIMPGPVIGALVFFTVCFMIVAGVQILTSRMMDARKTFVVGASVVLGLSVDMMPGAYQSVPAMLLPAFTSSLSVATLSALLLNLLFRIGIAQHAKLANRPSRGFFRANIRVYGEAGRRLGCAQGSDRPRQVCDERIHRSREGAGASSVRSTLKSALMSSISTSICATTGSRWNFL